MRTAEEKQIHKEERQSARHAAWKDGELGYLCCLVAQHGDDGVGHDPKSVANYLRLQAADAYRAELFVLAAHIGAAATAVNEDARNNHSPDWDRARKYLGKAYD